MMLKVAVKKTRGSFALDAGFEMPTPGVVALFGRSGCGKSTLVNIIAGLLDADSGHVALDGDVLLDTDSGRCLPPERRRIGYVFQDARLFPHLRVAANLRYGERRAGVPPYVSLDAVADLLDLGSLMNRRTHQLSGGERQRVKIALGLAQQPQLLLLDEPMQHLDIGRQFEMIDLIGTLHDEGIAILASMHDLSLIEGVFPSVWLLSQDEAMRQGSPREMLQPKLLESAFHCSLRHRHRLMEHIRNRMEQAI